jgi:hypothetical protein
MAMPVSDLESPSPAVFLQDFVDVDAPERLVSGRLCAGQRWLARLASAAGCDAEGRLDELGHSRLLITHEVRVRVGRPSRSRTGVVVPLRWEDAEHPGAVPVLDGNLEVAQIGPRRSRVVLYASYRPPPAEAIRATEPLDQALLQRVAESTVRSFLCRMAETLQSWPLEDHTPG